MKKILYIIVFLLVATTSFSQSGTDFWLAPPAVTDGHDEDPIHLRMSSGALPATITISQPANSASFNGGAPIVVSLGANSSTFIDLTPDIANLETFPRDQVLNTGLHISSTQNITAYYEINNLVDPEIYALKGESGLGLEFFTPFQTVWNNSPFAQHADGVDPYPYTSFDIVATQNNTTVLIYPRTPLDGGHPALASYSIVLNQGQTYSGSVSNANNSPTITDGNLNPTGTAIVSDKPIAVSVKDDLIYPNGSLCVDLVGDQLVPVDIVGTDYIVQKGQLTVQETVLITATRNGTAVTIGGVYQTTLFAGETYEYTITNPYTYIVCSLPSYCFHVSGFGCQLGGALLPPLNCAGSDQVNIVRSNPNFFALNILVPAGAEGNFTVNGNTSLITASDFTIVPGTSGLWLATQKQFSTAQIPAGTNQLITNGIAPFAVGIIHGDSVSGCRFGYFSEFAAKIDLDAGVNQTVCANDSANLSGSVAGGSTTGIWTGGTGQFLPNSTALNAIYVPSPADISLGIITLTLTSTGNCTPVDDQMQLSFTPAPVATAGSDISVCTNNSSVLLNGSVTVASSGVWSGGLGSFSPNSLTTTYSPTPAEISSGNVVLTLTTTGNGVCNAESDNLIVSFTPSPTVDAGVAQTVCENNSQVNLSGSKTLATGVIWSGNGTFSPNVNALNPTYNPTSAELLSGSTVLTLTTTGNGNCNAVSDVVALTFTGAPTVNANVDQTLCSNNSVVNLNGSKTVSMGAQWSGGLGIFLPNNNTLNATYHPTSTEIATGSLNLFLTTTGNGNCNAESDDMVVNFTPRPTAEAGPDQNVCANNVTVPLSGSVTIATGGVWSGGSGRYSLGSANLNSIYTPSSTEITNGSVRLYLTTTGNGNCISVMDSMLITIAPMPIVNAGVNLNSCANNSVVLLAGTISNATGGIWSGGTGSYVSSNTDLNASYTPSNAEILAGTANLTLTSTGIGNCTAVTDNLTISIIPSPTVNAGIDQSVCSNNATASLSGVVTGATGGQWTGGLGTYSPNQNTLNVSYSPTAAEIASGSLTLTLTTTGMGVCNAETDDVILSFTPSPVVDAGLPLSSCANNTAVTLNGSVAVSTGGIWSGGLGVYSTSNTDLNTDYTPSASEINNGSVQLYLTSTGNNNCTAVTDSVVITIAPTPIVSAGANLNSCANNSVVNLAGLISNATGGIWSGGTGNYVSSSTDLNASYTPSNTEVTAGTATLTLTSTGNGSCNAVTDAVTISIIPSPTADAGLDQTVCGNNSNVNLIGSVTGASGGQWTGALGTFTPSNNALNTTYTPTAAEITNGSVTITLTTTGVGVCNAVTDDVLITFTASPVSDAGLDLSSCENNPSVTLNGNISVSSGGQWTGGNGTYTPSNTDLGATYTPTSAEITTGSVMLTLQTTGNGNCNMETDNVLITIDPSPIVDAGLDQTICVSNLNVALSGSVSGVTNTGEWTTSGTGIFVPNNTVLNASYVPSSADSIAGTVQITLSSTNGNSCLTVVDDMTVTILPAGISNAGSDVTVCANNAVVSLSGTVSGGSSTGVWSTNGTGVFTPNAQTLTANYIPSSADAGSGTVTLTLTANSCDSDADDLTVTITPAPIVSAGSDITVCANSLTIPLTGSVSGATTTGLWSTNGTGVFTPSNSDLQASYVASSQDSINQTVVLVLTATGIGSCSAVTDTVIINIFPTGTADAGVDQILCSNNSNVSLNGVIGGGASIGEWNSSGSGTFTPSINDMNATYIPSTADLILGTVNISLSATNSCNNASDVIGVVFTPAPLVNAGSDVSICGSNAVVALSGSVTGAVSGEWSSNGTGIFSPNITDMNAIYSASTQDITNGSVWIYLTSIGNGDCNQVIDSLELTITAGVVVNAGINQTVCSSSSFTLLQGTVSNGATTGEWSTLGSGTFLPSTTDLTTEYHFGAGDLTNGSVNLVLTSTNNGSCVAETDTLTISFGNNAFASAGTDFTICASSPATPALQGYVSGGATTGEWSTLGSGIFSPNTTDFNASYIPSATDYSNGSFELILTTTDNGGCSAGKDTVLVSIESVPQANAGNPIQTCSTVDTLQLSGSVTNATFGEWSTSGTGTFFPTNTDLSAVYVPSLADQTGSSFQIYLTTIGNQICSNDVDSISVVFDTPLTVGFSNSVGCANNYMAFTDTTLIHFGTIGAWSWNFGDGGVSQSPNPSHLYTTAGAYDVTLEVTSNMGCSYSIIQSIVVQGSPTADFTFTNEDIIVGSEVGFNDLSSGGNEWYWIFGDGFGTDTDQNPTYSYSTAGSYNVIQRVTNSFGCSDTALYTIVILSDEDDYYPPVIPSGFSPNGDGENDVLFVRGGPFESVMLRVYNNWGNLIFESNDINIGWDGTHKGKELPKGDYVYSAIVVAEDGTEYIKKGSISIIR